jgi:hypothetical protein
VTVAFDAQSFKDITATDSFTHTPVRVPRLAVVMIVQDVSSADLITAVTYGGVAMERVTTAADLVTEPGRVYMYWLREPLASAQTVAVTVASGTDAKTVWAATFSGNAPINKFGHAILQGDQANPSRTFGTPSTFQGALCSVGFSGVAAPSDANIAPANSEVKLTGTDAGGKDFGAASGYAGYRIATGANAVTGYTITSDDLAFVAAAFQEEVGWFYEAPPLSYQEEILALSPSLYWTLDALTGATDLSGNGRDGTAAGGPTIGGHTATYAPIVGEDQSCTDLDGSDDRVNSSWSTSFSSASQQTFVAWVNRDATADVDAMMSGDGADPYWFFYNSGANDITFQPKGGSDVTWTGVGTTGSWQFLAVVVDLTANTQELYVDGVSQTSKTQASDYTATQGNFEIGEVLGFAHRFDGKMSHVAIWDSVALSAAQISHLWDVSGN